MITRYTVAPCADGEYVKHHELVDEINKLNLPAEVIDTLKAIGLCKRP